MNFDIILSPHCMSEMKDTSHKSWSGCKWKKISLNLLPQVVVAWVLTEMRVQEVPEKPQKDVMVLWRSENRYIETQLPRQLKHLKNFSSKLGQISDISGSGKWISGVKYPRARLNLWSLLSIWRRRFPSLVPSCRQTSRLLIFERSECSQGHQRRLQ